MMILHVAALLVAAALQEDPTSQAITFSEIVAPIVYENCVSCHRPGEAAPFSLTSYDDVKKRGPTIAAVTKSRYMPPWHAAYGYGEFKDERRLTDAQISAIDTWVKQGMPEGDPAKTPALPRFADGWQLGRPDLILECAEATTFPPRAQISIETSYFL
jgi:mono/diheme cytochrome c family protein